MMWTKFLTKLSRAFASFTYLIWNKCAFYELSKREKKQIIIIIIIINN